MDMTETTCQRRICVSADHPALPGHFPGDPLVPGVLLLEQVAIALQDWRNQRVASVSEAKFMRPLRPDQPAELELRDAGAGEAGSRIRFEIRRDDELLVRGLVIGVARTDASP